MFIGVTRHLQLRGQSQNWVHLGTLTVFPFHPSRFFGGWKPSRTFLEDLRHHVKTRHIAGAHSTNSNLVWAILKSTFDVGVDFGLRATRVAAYWLGYICMVKIQLRTFIDRASEPISTDSASCPNGGNAQEAFFAKSQGRVYQCMPRPKMFMGQSSFWSDIIIALANLQKCKNY